MMRGKKWTMAACNLQAPLYDIDPYVAAGLFQQESSFDDAAIRMEPGFWRKYVDIDPRVHPLCAPLLATSFGMGQCMGLTIIIETGAQALYERLKGNPVELVEYLRTYTDDPIAQVQVALAHLQRHLRNTGKIEAALLRYNGGGDPDYPKKVMDKAAALRREFPG